MPLSTAALAATGHRSPRPGGRHASPSLEADLERAIERDELRVHHLPIVDLRTREVLGVEALVRWQRAGEVLDAGRFLPLAERTGSIVRIGRWSTEAACAEVARWNQAHADRAPLRVSVNLSLRQLTEPDAVAHIQQVLDDSGLAPTQLSLEITEDSLRELGEAVSGTLLALKDLGVRLSVDDFGTGSSSLVALQRHHLDEIKIDRAFTAEIDRDAGAAALVRGVVMLAQSLGIETLAEGVERGSQEDVLRDLNCEAAQGWRYARPLADLDAAIAAADAALQQPTGVAPRRSTGRRHSSLGTPAGDRALRAALAGAEARARDLTEENERLARFTATVSHDLLQPVAVLSGFLSLLDHAREDLSEEHRAWLDGALRGKERIARAIEALRRHAGPSEIPLEAVDLSEVVADIVPGLLLELGDAQIDVGELPVVEADPGLVVQVLANVVHNSGRYRSADRPLVVRVEAVREVASWVLSVTDTGLGIASSELERVFEDGVRGAASTGTSGTGAGLATVRALMRRMRGDAWAEPARDGARICLRFAMTT